MGPNVRTVDQGHHGFAIFGGLGLFDDDIAILNLVTNHGVTAYPQGIAGLARHVTGYPHVCLLLGGSPPDYRH